MFVGSAHLNRYLNTATAAESIASPARDDDDDDNESHGRPSVDEHLGGSTLDLRRDDTVRA